jgi:hypothetical protein
MMQTTLLASLILGLAAPAAAALLPTSASQAQLHPIVAPTAYPNVTETDPWTCVTESVREIYFNPPKPSGALDAAMLSYGNKLIETCRTSGTYAVPCAFPDKTRWYVKFRVLSSPLWVSHAPETTPDALLPNCSRESRSFRIRKEVTDFVGQVRRDDRSTGVAAAGLLVVRQ